VLTVRVERASLPAGTKTLMGGVLPSRATFMGPTKGPTMPAEVLRTALRLTVPKKLLMLMTCTTVEALTPAGTSLFRSGTAATRKSGGGTVTDIGTLWLSKPEVPVTVMV
jgi:hypothetical protein